ncbi:MAG: hypothetical protein ACLUEV_11475 [Alistipes sp.]
MPRGLDHQDHAATARTSNRWDWCVFSRTMVWIAGDRETIEQVLVGTKPPVPKTEKKLVRRILRKK